MFSEDRATADIRTADKSNFLHPVLYYYKDYVQSNILCVFVCKVHTAIKPLIRFFHLLLSAPHFYCNKKVSFTLAFIICVHY